MPETPEAFGKNGNIKCVPRNFVRHLEGCSFGWAVGGMLRTHRFACGAIHAAVLSGVATHPSNTFFLDNRPASIATLKTFAPEKARRLAN